MKVGKDLWYDRLYRKALTSPCRYKIAAIGIDHKGNVIDSVTNIPRFPKKFGGIHAERYLMKRTPKSLKTIIIIRVGLSGAIRPISPCTLCRKAAEERGIKIVSVLE